MDTRILQPGCQAKTTWIAEAKVCRIHTFIYNIPYTTYHILYVYSIHYNTMSASYFYAVFGALDSRDAHTLPAWKDHGAVAALLGVTVKTKCPW